MIDLPGLILQSRLAQLAQERHQAQQAAEAEDDDAGSPDVEHDRAEGKDADAPI